MDQFFSEMTEIFSLGQYMTVFVQRFSFSYLSQLHN